MISLYYFYIICFSSAVFLSAESQIISAPVGSTVILPCQWRNITVQTPHVQWSNVFETVFERKGENIYEGKGYENRVDVPQDKLLKGNCSLVLKKVRISDAGIYDSLLSVKRMKRASTTKWVLLQSIELAVYETPGGNIDVSLPAADGAGVKNPRLQTILLSLLLCLLFRRVQSPRLLIRDKCTPFTFTVDFCKAALRQCLL
ncbi:hypothetical protein C0J50_8741 [Silurus asotus]|uniref:Immunoglobulin V-set domain-containing protein n=1 Tax=Silurus asotus TaxID=30991 RepID=A0AAD5AHY6_SILAS|nr:hypothetical protein C0J50_8741 [Silurus asotus]